MNRVLFVALKIIIPIIPNLFHFPLEKHLQCGVNTAIGGPCLVWLEPRKLPAWKAAWAESGMLWLSTAHRQWTIMVKWLTPNSCDGIELLWMKCYVSRLCLCYFTTLSVQTTLSGTDGQRHRPPVTTAKQIHCHIDSLSPNAPPLHMNFRFSVLLFYIQYCQNNSLTPVWSQELSP